MIDSDIIIGNDLTAGNTDCISAVTGITDAAYGNAVHGMDLATTHVHDRSVALGYNNPYARFDRTRFKI